MNVLLISVYELGHQPLGLASPAAHLLDRGFSVQCLDLSIDPFDGQRVRDADAVGISIPMHTATRIGLRFADRIRAENPEAVLYFYGLYASLNAGILFEHGAAAVIGGEFEEPMADWLDAIRSGRAAGGIAGVATPGRHAAPFLGRTRFRKPARHLLPPLERYAHLHSGEELVIAGAVEASRGCAHVCLHCPITPVYAGRVRIVDSAVVREDIRALHDMGARHVTFSDPDFLNAVRHSLAVARSLHADFPGTTFDITAKVEHIVEHSGVVEELAGLGLNFIVSAVESLNDGVLRILDKGHTRRDVEAAFAIAARAGVALRPSLVSFTPWTRKSDYRDVLDFVEEHGLHDHVDAVQYAIRLLVPPGSPLADAPEFLPHAGSFDAEALLHEWNHPDPDMDALHEAVMRIVEDAARQREDALTTFDRIRTAADAGTAATRPRRRNLPPPRLTEAWFC